MLKQRRVPIGSNLNMNSSKRVLQENKKKRKETLKEALMCAKHFNQTPPKSLPEANLHSDEGTSSHVGGTGKHPGLWTVCQPKQLVVAIEGKRRRKRRNKREGGTAFKCIESICCQRESNKGGKTDCVLKCVVSSGASVKTRKSVSNEEALQPLNICYQHQIGGVISSELRSSWRGRRRKLRQEFYLFIFLWSCFQIKEHLVEFVEQQWTKLHQSPIRLSVSLSRISR